MCTLLCTMFCNIHIDFISLRKHLTDNEMDTLSIRNFRSNMATSLNRVDAGEQIFIRRNRQLYAIVPVGNDDLTITPELRAKIDRARKAYREGTYVVCLTPEEITAHLDAL